MKELRSLDTQIHYQGYTLTQVKRVGKYALYRVDDGTHYEVIHIQVREAVKNAPRRTPTGVIFDVCRGAIEIYPKSEEWGKYGWTYTTLEAAENKFSSLTS